MKNNIYAMWQSKAPVKIKNRGNAALATTSMSNNTKIQSVNNRYVWPSYFSVETKEGQSTKKVWS